MAMQLHGILKITCVSENGIACLLKLVGGMLQVTQDCFVVNHVTAARSPGPEQKGGFLLAQLLNAAWWPL